MKIGILALTDRGLATALRIGENLPGSAIPTFCLHAKALSAGAGKIPKAIPLQPFQRLGDLVPTLWQECSVLIFIMASGIVVRQIASLIDRKDRDPAVLVLDEAGNFVIPLLSGHLGGANAWAREIAKHLQAQAVITTATDGRGITAPDEYARRFGWKVEPVDHLPAVNRLLLEQGYLNVLKPDDFSIDQRWLDDPHYRFMDCTRRFAKSIIGSGNPKDIKSTKSTKSTNVSQEINLHELQTNPNVIIDAFPSGNTKKDCIYLIPPVLSVGVGCRRGISSNVVLDGITSALEQIGASLKAISGLYSIDLKADEAGLQEAAKSLGVPFRTFSADELQAVNSQENLTRSNFVKEKIGVDGVCEAASILGAHMGHLILPKTKGQGVTVAISTASSMSWDLAPETPST
ncbi:cobalt-precorrin 5A hydrolase [Desulfosporosinus sp. FKB]|uniref:cobalt-precorrin 5A hydrolase n=1 Tax=Desulfosporosinus sp. FKB TaxID=1969835 RepID=UPI001FA8FF73|nr:cobalt-precorrin 5A hydrolase [Desulfosporosinus sp. FKB]